MLAKNRSVRPRPVIATSELERRRAYRSFTVVWLEEITFLLDVTYPIDQPEKRKSIKFEALPDGTDGRQAYRR
jgi:hypothetical protein